MPLNLESCFVQNLVLPNFEEEHTAVEKLSIEWIQTELDEPLAATVSWLPASPGLILFLKQRISLLLLTKLSHNSERTDV